MLRILVTTFLMNLISWSALAEESEHQFVPLYQYKPIYFLLGQTYTKIEVSFKVQIVSTIPIYFGYSQLMMWDLFLSSPFFRDLNYNPELFYRLLIPGEKDQWLDFGPLDHESNGKGG